MSTPGASRVKITVLPSGQELHIPDGPNLLEALQAYGLDVPTICGGMGTCGQCKVRFVTAAPTSTDEERALLSAEQIAQGWRLACRHCVASEATISLSPSQLGSIDSKSRLDIAPEVEEIDPGIYVHHLQASSSERDDQQADVERLSKMLGEQVAIPLRILRQLPAILRDNGPRVTAIAADDGVIDLLRTDQFQGVYGVALDVGTSTLAGYLFDLATGKQLAVAGCRNPQERFGADVISRIRHVQETGENGLEDLQTLVVGAVNELIELVARRAGVSIESIYKATIVGNPTMLHLLLGIDPSAIGHSPYVPVFRDGVSLRAQEVDLYVSPLARVELLPGISAYVGADVLAGMLSVDMGRRNSVELLLDIGTNGEIVLSTGSKLLTCSAAAGPAFEGGSITQGMSALDGAIEHVSLQGREVCCSVVGGKPARGICGSGLLNAVAGLRTAGLIDSSGRLQESGNPLSERIEGQGSKARFLLEDDEAPVYLTQQDIREFQLAKSAIRTGIEILIEEASISADKIERVFIGGAFGSSLQPESLLRVGLLPKVPQDSIVPVGNCAGQGAKLAMLNQREMQKLESLQQTVQHVELSSCESFQRRFVNHIRFP